MITINGKEYNLFFGMKFLEEIDRISDGSLNEGLAYLLATAIYDVNLLSIAKLLKACLNTYPEITPNDIDEYLETVDDKALTKLVGFIKSTAKACNATKTVMKEVEKLIKKSTQENKLA